MRSQWIDKATGKVINLSNYSFSQMSGWGGYQFDWSAWNSDIAGSGGSVTRTKTSIRMTNTGTQPRWTIAYAMGLDSINSFRIRVSGLKPGRTLYFKGATILLTITEDGIYAIPSDASAPSNYSFSTNGYSKNENTDLLIEQLPYYPGALVSDGVDDRGLGAEPITEEIKTVVMHLVGLAPVWAFFIEGADGDQTKRIGATYSNGKLSVPGIGNIENDGKPYGFNRNVPAPNNRLNIGCAERVTNPTEYGKSAIRRLIFIKEQLDAAQLEFLEWKVEKEYRDWCKENGYEYAISEMLNN